MNSTAEDISATIAPPLIAPWLANSIAAHAALNPYLRAVSVSDHAFRQIVIAWCVNGQVRAWHLDSPYETHAEARLALEGIVDALHIDRSLVAFATADQRKGLFGDPITLH